ncbi:MAG: heavy metal translocating P-type ATPase [Candidatus Cloacimonetes bacterium]|nr:heavy metal translocating P-type ATPase [Candidatus Cloacimonadota bacterium]
MKKYYLKNLDCANCAANIEASLKKLEYVRSISIDFSSASMFIDTDFIDKVVEEMKKKEPDIEVLEKESFQNVKIANEKNKTDFNPHIELWITVICVIVYILALIFNKKLQETPFMIGSWIVFVSIYLVAGWRVLLKAFKNIRHGGFFDENFLMTIATLGAFAIGELPEAAGVMIFFKVGSYLQELSIFRSRRSIKALLEIRPDYANVVHNAQIFQVSPEEVDIDSEIIVKPGEKIPLDGEIISGSSQLDTSALTGESIPKIANEKDSVLAGMINLTGLLRIKVTKHFAESSIAKILEMVENATHKKAKTEMFFTTFARYYTPVIVGIALLTALLPPLLMNDQLFSDWIYRALVILVISCPCALVVSIPLTYFGGIGAASRKGILIKGSSFIDSLNRVRTIVFDKTGTLTKGVFQVTKIKNYLSGKSNTSSLPFTDNDLLQITAEAEAHSNHPIALSILKAYSDIIDKKNEPIDYSVIKDYQELAGKGISVNIREKKVLVGNAKLMSENNIDFVISEDIGTIVYTAIDGVFAGHIVISDELKEDSTIAIKRLRDMGIHSIQMLTGDNLMIAEDLSKKLSLDSFYSELLPEDKVEKLEQIIETKNKKEKLVYVGDGINDAPVIALADVGISMGSLGSDAAIETADVVIMNDSLNKIPDLLRISKKTRNIIIQNVTFALSVKILFLILGISDHASIWEAVFADVGVALIAVLNAMRIMKT